MPTSRIGNKCDFVYAMLKSSVCSMVTWFGAQMLCEFVTYPIDLAEQFHASPEDRRSKASRFFYGVIGQFSAREGTPQNCSAARDVTHLGIVGLCSNVMSVASLL